MRQSWERRPRRNSLRSQAVGVEHTKYAGRPSQCFFVRASEQGDFARAIELRPTRRIRLGAERRRFCTEGMGHRHIQVNCNKYCKKIANISLLRPTWSPGTPEGAGSVEHSSRWESGSSLRLVRGNLNRRPLPSGNSGFLGLEFCQPGP